MYLVNVWCDEWYLMDVKDISLGRVKDHPLSTSQLGTFKSSHKGGSCIKESRDSNLIIIKLSIYLQALKQ